MSEHGASNVIESLQSSQLMRILGIGLLVLLLQIPIAMVRGVISEREQTRLEALQEVTAKWGEQQALLGPRLVVPYRHRWIESTDAGTSKQRSSLARALFLAERLEISARIDSETRYRGIFEVPVYAMELEVRGIFERPDFSDWGVEPEDIHWERAHFVVGLSDPRAIEKPTSLSWNGEVFAFQPGAGEGGADENGIHALLGDSARTGQVEFAFPLSLRGSVGVFFVPFGKETVVTLDSDWSDPSFQGAWLPTEREVTDEGFHATWEIPYLGRNYPQRWPRAAAHSDAVAASLFGVELLAPVDHYRMALRSAKYGALFLALTFGSLWLFEVLAGVPIHSIQYLLVGAGMCLFYLLEVSLAEHLGFVAAYAIATSAVVLLVSGYCVAVLGGSGRAAVVGSVLVSLYGYLYVLLRNQDYALLVGSVGLFFAVAAVMYLTRTVDWHALGRAFGSEAVRRTSRAQDR
jgi:inner membrane protein